MYAFIKKIGSGYIDYMIRRGRSQARHVLMAKSDAILEDLGISRELLESGVSAWPWTEGVEQFEPVLVSHKVEPSRRQQMLAIRELQALSDRELHDIGVGRGSIAEMVRFGRPDIDVPVIQHNSWNTLANDSIGTATVNLDDTAANAPLSKSAAA
ncbi:MAG: DUF1127 domain-containing protein [Granulosicoccus sp.]